MKKEFKALKCKFYFKTKPRPKKRPVVTLAGSVQRLTGRKNNLMKRAFISFDCDHDKGAKEINPARIP
jgi:glycerophosphoryl diester phosphodiesterase